MYSKWYYFCFQFSPDSLFAVLKENVNFFNKVGEKKLPTFFVHLLFYVNSQLVGYANFHPFGGLGIFAYIHLPGKGQDSLFRNEFGNCTCKREFQHAGELHEIAPYSEYSILRFF